jgi:hypothetical protein
MRLAYSPPPFFSRGEVTAYPIHIPAEFELNDEQNANRIPFLPNAFRVISPAGIVLGGYEGF